MFIFVKFEVVGVVFVFAGFGLTGHALRAVLFQTSLGRNRLMGLSLGRWCGT
jgi:hypothetical protein